LIRVNLWLDLELSLPTGFLTCSISRCNTKETDSQRLLGLTLVVFVTDNPQFQHHSRREQMKKSAALFALFLFMAGLSFVLAAQDPQQGGRPITITMTGAAEVPGPGDPDGTGTATITLNPGKGEVCYELTVDKIATANAAHIHSGAVDKAGPPVLTLKAPANGSSKECRTN
jgi:hypothetical protein